MSVDARIMTSLPSHPKTKKLIRRHGQGAAWNLVCLFLFARANKPDGDFAGFTIEDIELASDWTGNDGEFVQALLDVGYLELQDGEYSIHDWAEHNPWSAGAELRSLKAKWNAVKRHHGEAEADRLVPEYRTASKEPAKEQDATSNATSKEAAKTQEETSNAPLPSPLPSPSPSPPKESSSPSGSRLAQDWSLPADWKTWAEQERPDLDVLDQAQRFADYWHGVAGAKGRKADWLATWRNWIRNSNAGSRPRAGPNAPQEKSKGRQAIELLEGLKHGMDAQGNRYGPAKADMPRLG